VNWEAIRAEFPALAHWTYLNTATYGQLPLRSQAAVARHFAHRDELACQDFLGWFDDADELRGLLAQLIHCHGEDIAFTSTAGAALSLFLGGIDWRPGDRILTLADEFPNQYYYANWLGRRGVELVEMAEIPAAGADTLPERTRAIILSTVNYTSGYRPDLERISKLAHAAGALLYVDGTQSLGALRFDVQSVKPDLFAVDGYKWLLCPNGATFFYISPALRRTLEPAVIGWRSDRGWRLVDDLHHGAPQLLEGAERYEGGMLNFPSLYAMAESVRMVVGIGPDVIERRVLNLSAQVADTLRGAGAQIRHPGSNIVAARWTDRDASELAKTLAGKKIVVAARHGNLRVSPHFYNDESDIAALAAAISEPRR
jgi:cysteine desulfurase / selenocysteine lyase